MDTIAELLNHLLKNSQGQTQLLLIIILFVVYVTEKILKYKSGSTLGKIFSHLSSLSGKVNDIRKDNENNFSIVIRTLNETLSGLEGRLDTNHVFIVMEIYSTSIKICLFEVVENIFYDDELSESSRREFTERMQRRFETIIHESDQQFYELPDVNPAITSTKEKKKQFKEENIYEALFDVVIKNRDNHPRMKSLSTELLNDSISKWRLR